MEVINNIKDINELVVESEFLHVQANNDKLTIETTLSPRIIDMNFNELSTRMRELEEKNRKLETQIQKLEHKINILNAVNVKLT